jgi:hypothetical protein
MAVLPMPYSLFKNHRRENGDHMKTNLIVNGVGGNPMESRGVVSIEPTVGSKLLATSFFIMEVQGNYHVILGHDLIHANRCVCILLCISF